MELLEKIQEAVQFLRKVLPDGCPGIGVVLGSGLSGFVDGLENRVAVDVSGVPHWPVPTVRGHEGRLVFGKLEGVEILVLRGRVHLYEGYSAQDVGFPVRVLGRMGVKSLVLTHAAGALHPDFVPGDLMLITDHVNLMFDNPLMGPHDVSLGERFPDMWSAETR